MDTGDESTLELFGAITLCLSRAIAIATPAQLSRFEAEVLNLLEGVAAESAAANAFRSVLREVESCRARASPQ